MVSTYSKPAIDLLAQVAKLRSRGLEITDDTKSKKALLNIGYYRLSGYSLPAPHMDGDGSTDIGHIIQSV